MNFKYELLYQNLRAFSNIPQEEWQVLTEKLQERTLEKGEYFLKAGEQAEDVAFILSGWVRQFYVTEDGSEFNHAFNFENRLMAGYPSLLTATPSNYFIQAMEKTNLLVMKYSEFIQFYDRHACWERLGRVAAESNYVDKVIREHGLLIKDARTRYLDTITLHPEIGTRVPQYHLASYLGITASALNRIIKKIREEEEA